MISEEHLRVFRRGGIARELVSWLWFRLFGFSFAGREISDASNVLSTSLPVVPEFRLQGVNRACHVP